MGFGERCRSCEKFESFGVDGLKFEHEFMKFDPTGQFCRTCPRSSAELVAEVICRESALVLPPAG